MSVQERFKTIRQRDGYTRTCDNCGFSKDYAEDVVVVSDFYHYLLLGHEIDICHSCITGLLRPIVERVYKLPAAPPEEVVG